MFHVKPIAPHSTAQDRDADAFLIERIWPHDTISVDAVSGAPASGVIEAGAKISGLADRA